MHAGDVDRGVPRPAARLRAWSCIEAVGLLLPEAVQARGRAFVTGTIYDGRETMRACILHPGSTETDLATLVVEVVALLAADLAATVSDTHSVSASRRPG